MEETDAKQNFENRTGVVQWIDYLRFSLADIVARGEWDDFGLFRFLNRTSFLSTKHLIFVIYRTDEKGRLIADREISEFDPIVQGQFFKKLCEDGFARYMKSDGAYKILKKPTKDYGIPIFETDNRLLIYAVDLEYKQSGVEPIINFNAVSTSSDIGWFFKEVFEPFDGKNGRAKLIDPIHRHFKVLLNFSQHQRAMDKVPSPDDLSEDDHVTINRSLERMLDFVDIEYKRLCNSPLLRSYSSDIDQILDEKEISDTEDDQYQIDDVEYNDYHIADLMNSPCNIFIFGKIFRRDSPRYKGTYFYDPVFLAKTQIVHIETFLSRIYFNKISNGKGNEPKRSDFIRYGNKKYEDKFWRLCHNQNSHKKIIEYLIKPWPDHIRMFAENILMTGAITIHPNVFENGGIGWIDKEALKYDANGKKNQNYQKDLDDAYMRLVCFHYVMQFASPVAPKKATNLSLISVPIRVSGGVWMCATYLRENIESSKLSSLINQEQFDKSYLIYHSLLRELERRLRYKGRNEYENSARNLIREIVEVCHVKGLEEGRIGKDKVVVFTEEVDIFNNHIGLLTRLYPFYQLRLIRKGRKKSEYDKYDLEIGMEQNEYFDRLVLKRFITGNRVKKEAYTQALQELLYTEINIAHGLALGKKSND